MDKIVPEQWVHVLRVYERLGEELPSSPYGQLLVRLTVVDKPIGGRPDAIGFAGMAGGLPVRIIAYERALRCMGGEPGDVTEQLARRLKAGRDAWVVMNLPQGVLPKMSGHPYLIGWCYEILSIR